MRKLQFAFLGLLMMAGSAAARGGMPEPLTERGRLIEGIYYQIFVAGVLVFLFVMALMAYVIVRYRASSGHGKATFEAERHNMKLELVWIIIPLAIMLWIGFISYHGLVVLDEDYDSEDAYGTYHITASQWNWQMDYGDGVSKFASPDPSTGTVSDANRFILPAGVPLEFVLTSVDVIHAWAMLDENLNQFAILDANPTGPHKENSMIVKLPAGEFDVQCKEMCFNPGHSYMRAKVDAVPVAQYEEWLARERLLAPCSFQQAELLAAGNGQALTGATLANDGCAVIDIENTGSTPLTAATTTAGPQTAVTIAPGDTGLIVFEPRQAGTATIALSDGGKITFDVIEATPVDVQLGDFFITPVNLDLDVGTTYLLRLDNVGSAAHNLYIGGAVADGEEAAFRSQTISGGAKTNLLITPDAPMTFTTWCNIPGHANAGMVASLVVA